MKEKIVSGNSEQLIPSFSLPSSVGGKPIGPADFRQDRNLVILFMDALDCDHCVRLLHSLKERAGEYRQLNAAILAVAPAALPDISAVAAELGAEVILLADENQAVLESYIRDMGARPPFLIVADRYGAFYGRMELEAGEDIDHKKVESLLGFIENQCPECGVPRDDVAM